MRLSFEHDLAHNYVIPEAEVPNGEASFPETEYELCWKKIRYQDFWTVFEKK